MSEFLQITSGADDGFEASDGLDLAFIPMSSTALRAVVARAQELADERAVRTGTPLSGAFTDYAAAMRAEIEALHPDAAASFDDLRRIVQGVTDTADVLSAAMIGLYDDFAEPDVQETARAQLTFGGFIDRCLVESYSPEAVQLLAS